MPLTKLTVNYDGNARPITYAHTANSGGTIAGFAYGYDKEDNMLFEKRLHSTKGDAFVYDSIYRLTGVKYGVPNTDLNPSTPWANYATYDNKEDFTLDGANNWVNRTYNGSTTSYTSNILNQYTQINSTTLTYDYNGNLKDDGTYLYYYDYANRLMEVKRKNDSTIIVDYQYDALGRRIEKANYLTAVTIDYYHDGARVIEERNASDTVLATYTHGNGIDEILTMERNSQTYYYHENVQGSIYAVTNSSGNIVEKYEYTAYGKVTFFDGSGNQISSSTIGNNYLYTGREYDSEIDLYYYRARFYSVNMGRFLQRDPIADDDLMNLYTYVGNSPLNFIDPLGLEVKKSAASESANSLNLYASAGDNLKNLPAQAQVVNAKQPAAGKALQPITQPILTPSQIRQQYTLEQVGQYIAHSAKELAYITPRLKDKNLSDKEREFIERFIQIRESNIELFKYYQEVLLGYSTVSGGKTRTTNTYGRRYQKHLNKYLINVGPYATALLGGLWPKSWVPWTGGRGPGLGSNNPLTSVPRALRVPGAGSSIVRTGAAGIGVATVAVGFYNVGVFLSGLVYAAIPGYDIPTEGENQ
jgi:RHS repeat-associated protein